VLIGGAAINRDFSLRALYPKGREADDVYEPGVFFCKDAFEGLARMDEIVDDDARAALVQRTRVAAKRLREQGPEPEALKTDDDSVRSKASIENPVPTPPFWGVRELEIDLDEVYPYLDTHVLFKLHWGGRGVKGEAWRTLISEDFLPRLERMWREQTYLHPRALLGYFPCYSEGNEVVVLDPDDHDSVLQRFVFPRQPGNDRICLADFYRPRDSGELDVVSFQAVTVGDEVTELMAQLEADGEFAEQLFVHGLGVQTAEGLAEWTHARMRSDLGIARDQGRRWAWGYGACPDQSEHTKLFDLIDAPSIGLRLSGGFAIEPEQSTVAITSHHPQAIYFSMKNGRLLKDYAPDEVIAGSDKDPSRLDGATIGDALPDADPLEGDAIEGEAAPVLTA